MFPTASANFAANTDNTDNIVSSDTLDPPTALVATDGVTVALNWTATTDTYADGHRIYRSTTPGGPYVLIAQISPRTTVSHLDNPPVGTHYYVARAFYGNWESTDSNEDAATATIIEDYDAVITASDNCPTAFNINQFDSDNDTIGDACDPSPTTGSTGIFTDSTQTLGTANSWELAFGDVDGDGDLDAMTANFSSQPNAVWVNDGSGTFTDSGQALGTGSSRDLAFGDVDDDGDLDAMVVNWNEPNTVWINNGTGTYTDSGQTLGTAASFDVVFGDIEGDGDLDAMVANWNEPNTVWINNGTGTYTDSGQTLGTAASYGMEFGDVDGDGDLDAMIANDSQPNTVWINDGSGTFTDSGQTLGIARSRDVEFGDIDGDGDLDAMVANINEPNIVWVNDGTGTFTDSGQTLGTDPSRDVEFGDVDGDGDLDAIIPNWNKANAVWLNDGTGTFTDSGQAHGIATSYGVELGDVDGDGDLDAMIANNGVNRVWLNDESLEDYDGVVVISDNCPSTFNINQYDSDGDTIGDACDPSPTVASSGIFTKSSQTFGFAYTESIALGDFDGDGDLDMTYGNRSATPNYVLLNDGAGTITYTGQTLGASDSEGGAVVADLDGDGDIDIAYGNFAQPNTVWVNDGTANFTDSGQTLGTSDTEDSALGDFDGDGDLDIAYANDTGQPNTVWFNDGAGTFTDSGQTLGSQWTEGLAIGDFDGDGDLDITYANDGNGAGAANTVWLNNGTGSFTNSGQTLGSGPSEGAAVADLDGDGDLDITFANSTTANTVWLNNGAGTFTDSGQSLGSSDSQDAAAGDVDGDGDLDIIYANDNQPNRIWLNDGTGSFTDSGQTMGSAQSEALAVGDLDGDGDLDLAFANTVSSQNTLWINDLGPAVGLADSWQPGLTHVPGAGSDRLLVFVASNEQQAATTPSLVGVTYGGQPLTHVVSDEELYNFITSRVEVWVLDEAGIAAAVGTALSPTWTAAPDVAMYSHAIFDNVDQTTPTAATTTGTVGGDTPNPVPMSSVVTGQGDIVIAAVTAGEAGTYTPQNAFILGLTQDTTVGGTSAHGTAYKPAIGFNETVSMLFNPTNPPWTNRQIALAMVINHAP